MKIYMKNASEMRKRYNKYMKVRKSTKITIKHYIKNVSQVEGVFSLPVDTHTLFGQVLSTSVAATVAGRQAKRRETSQRDK